MRRLPPIAQLTVCSLALVVIGGILMASYKTTEQQAFDLLRIASQTTHRKLADIAEDVLLTGTLDVPASPEQRSRAK